MMCQIYEGIRKNNAELQKLWTFWTHEQLYINLKSHWKILYETVKWYMHPVRLILPAPAWNSRRSWSPKAKARKSSEMVDKLAKTSSVNHSGVDLPFIFCEQDKIISVGEWWMLKAPNWSLSNMLKDSFFENSQKSHIAEKHPWSWKRLKKK